MDWTPSSDRHHPTAGGGANDDVQPPRRKEIPLLGPRPAPLKVNKESQKIKKPPLPLPFRHQHPAAAAPVAADHRQPVIIYDVSPQVIHANPSDFMSVVQRLTGMTTSSSDHRSAASSSSSADVPASPAARLAALERASPTTRRAREMDPKGGGDQPPQQMGLPGLELSGGNGNGMLFDLGQLPGILSPAPGNLPAVTAGVFQPPADSAGLFGFQDSLITSPFSTNLVPSPGTINSLFSAASSMASPTFSPTFDLTNIFNP